MGPASQVEPEKFTHRADTELWGSECGRGEGFMEDLTRGLGL